MKFLSDSILPYGTLAAFKADFYIMKTMILGPRAFLKEVGVKNIDKLSALIAPHCFRVEKKDCLDLKDKCYKELFVPMTPKMRHHYDEMKKMLMTQLEGTIVTAANALSAMIKLQQMLSGYIKSDVKNVMTDPIRYETVINHFFYNEDLGANGEKFIIFFRFLEEIKLFKYMLRKMTVKGQCQDAPIFFNPEENAEDQLVTYSGEENSEERTKAVERFQNDPTCRLFLASSAAARGLTLTKAKHVIYFSQDFNLETRLQSEDRAHRIGQEDTVTYWNVICPNSIDMKISDALSKKQDISKEISKDWRRFFND
jgi:SNF2 family DNA or RNA helicase